MAWLQRVTDSANGVRNSIEWLFYNQRGQLLGGLVFNNATCRIMSRRPDNSLTDTGLTFERGRVYPVKLRLDFQRKIMDRDGWRRDTRSAFDWPTGIWR